MEDTPQHLPADIVQHTTKQANKDAVSVEDRREIEKAFISEISGYQSNWKSADSEKSVYGSQFLHTASQINADFTIAAQCEFEKDFCLEDPDPDFCDLCRSVMYWKLRETFIEDALQGDATAFATAIWRAYNAGRVSPDRFIPATRGQRNARYALEVAQDMEDRALTAQRRAQNTTAS